MTGDSLKKYDREWRLSKSLGWHSEDKKTPSYGWRQGFNYSGSRVRWLFPNNHLASGLVGSYLVFVFQLLALDLHGRGQ